MQPNCIMRKIVSSLTLVGLMIVAISADVARGAPAAPVDADSLDFDEIVFVKRKPYSSDHYYTDITNGTSGDRFLPNNGVYVYNLRKKAARAVVTAADMPGGSGFIGKISLSFDATKVVFDFRQDARSGFRIWEVNVDGTGLRQVLKSPRDESEKVSRWGRNWHTDDIHPCYLPDGRIVFSSTRCEHTVLCGGSAALVAPGLHTMKADGTDVKQLTRSPVSEFCPVVLSDGRIMYHRWEYVDKGARVGKTIWSVNPDGTGPQELYGLDDDTTTVYMYPQEVPGSDHQLVSVGTCHFPQGGCLGAIMLIDYENPGRARGPDPDEEGYLKTDPRYAVTNITPHVFIERRTEPGWHFLTDTGNYVHDRNGKKGHLYTHPYPINEREFLVSYKVDPVDHYKNVADAYSLYLLGIDGEHQFIYADEELSCWHPLPLVPRRVPPSPRSTLNAQYTKTNQAVCVVTDIHQGMDGVQPGEIKWLRINEAVPRYWDTGRRWGSSLSSSSWKAALWPRVQWGVVPVEKDGSAHFLVPADRSIFFQALDENFREVQRERTYVNYAVGEVRSCTGCHGHAGRDTSPPSSATPAALTRKPSVPQPQPCDLVENGGDGKAGQVIHYPTDIQPIFDAKCVSCHGKTDPAGKLRLTGEVTSYYNTSYEQLASKELAGPLISEFQSFRRGDQGNYNGALLPPRSLGSAKGLLIELLSNAGHPKNAGDDHSEMVTDMERMILTRWADANYQFYGSYYGRHHPKWQEKDPGVPAYNPANDFRRKATFEEANSFFAPEWHR